MERPPGRALNRRALSRSAGGLALAAAALAAGASVSDPASAQPARAHRVVFHVGSGDPGLMNVALHNITNLADAYAAKNQTVAIELVANGPGYTMLRADTSPVKAFLAEVHKRYPFVVFAACQMSRKGAAAAEGKQPGDIPELPEATDIAAGVVRLTELQEQGWSYIRV
jgi:hypothetical protein